MSMGCAGEVAQGGDQQGPYCESARPTPVGQQGTSRIGSREGPMSSVGLPHEPFGLGQPRALEEVYSAVSVAQLRGFRPEVLWTDLLRTRASWQTAGRLVSPILPDWEGSLFIIM